VEAYRSLRAQDDVPFEWIVVLDKVSENALPLELRVDRRIRFLSAPKEAEGTIGALKGFAVSQSRGDVLVEFDHDDVLVPFALSKIASIAERFPEAFIFSDDAPFEEGSNRPVPYSNRYGWDWYPVSIYNRTLLATRCFDISPASLYTVHYAPDHVRCWTRQAYEAAGGYDETLKIGDDHDLICRTYLAGVDFVYVPECLYLYRYHRENSYKAHQKELSQQQKEAGIKYTRQLVYEWCDRTGKEVADVTTWMGAGWQPNDPLPQTDNPLGLLTFSSEMSGRLPRNVIQKLVERCYEALCPGGWLLFDGPATEGVTRGRQPVTVYGDGSLSWAYDKSVWPEGKCDFQLAHQYVQTMNGRMIRSFDMCAFKGGRFPGRPWKVIWPNTAPSV
jgi:glycosyltransferase involved in cell wall biosynthesis